MSTNASANGTNKPKRKKDRSSEYEDVILDPLPPQDRTSPAGQAMLTLAHFVNRVASVGGSALLIIAGGANFGVILLASILHRVSPGNATLPLWLAGISTFLWLGLALTRWMLASGDEPVGPNYDPGSGAAYGGAPFRTSGPHIISGSANAPRPGAGFAQSAWHGDEAETKSEPDDSVAGDKSKAEEQQSPEFQAAESFERAQRAADEFQIRRRTLFPRVEAAQRSARILVGGPEQPRWLARDLRPLFFFFIAVAASVPVMMFTAVITLISLLVSSSPF